MQRLDALHELQLPCSPEPHWPLGAASFIVPGAHCARELQQGGSATLLDAVRAVLAKATAKVCYHATEALPELLQLGNRHGWVLD